MKKFKLLSTLLISAFSICALSGCTMEEMNINDELPSSESIIKDGVNIESITVENVPNAIPIGSFDTWGMYIKLVYSDTSEETYPLTISTLPKSVRHYFNVVGEYTLTLAFRGEVTYTFNVIEGVEKYTVTYYSYNGEVVQREDVIPGGSAHMAPPAVPSRPEDALFTYSNPRWDKTVPLEEELFTSYDVYPLYDKIQKRYNSRELMPTSEGQPFRILKADSSDYYGEHEVWLHVGRLERVPLIYSEPQEKTVSPTSVSLYFDNSSITKTEENTGRLQEEILAKSFNVDTSHFSDYFVASGSNPITNPILFNGDGFNIRNKLNNDNPLTMLKGDTSYTPLYLDNVYTFVKNLGEDNKDEFEINFPQDMIDTNTNYYRGAIEGSVDVVAKISYNTLLESQQNKILFRYLEYYFLYDASNTFHNAEFSNTTTFGAAGNRITFNMAQLDKVLKDALIH